MGLIAARPEEPQDWAGIPSEPKKHGGDAERLDDPPVTASDPFAFFPATSGESITIPVAPPTTAPAPDHEAPRN